MVIIPIHSSGWRSDETYVVVEIAKKLMVMVKKRRRTEKTVDILKYLMYCVYSDSLYVYLFCYSQYHHQNKPNAWVYFLFRVFIGSSATRAGKNI